MLMLGVEGAKAVLARHPELMAYLIYTDEKGQLTTWASPALSDFQ